MFYEIGDFSATIAKLPRIISFDDVNWQRVSQESSTLHFRVRAYTYQFKPEVDDEINRALYSTLLLLALMGCKANQDSLEDFVVQVEAKAKKEVEQLVPATEFSAANYQRRAFRPPL